jgi:UDP-N-acetylmuramoyl-L-alanyl-D-glutamate--2,6-diaminopimelate ligase
LAGAEVVGDTRVVVTGLTHDSRQVQPGFAFAALRGERSDGLEFVEQALRQGAAALIVPAAIEIGVPQIVVEDTRAALGEAAAACHGDPTRRLALVGITGTNGKTTITYLLESALRAAGERPGVMGTVDYRFADRRWHAHHTTPEATVIQSVARRMLDAGASHLLMEVSSHGLALGRLGGCAFDVVAFTNLTQDHLDFHADMEDYAAAKLRLFTAAIADLPDARAVVNADDPFASTILEQLRHPVTTVSCDPSSGAPIRPVEPPRFGIDGIRARLTTPVGEGELNSPLLGAHNLSNLLVALGIGLQLGVSLEPALQGLSGLSAVPGRLEPVQGGSGFTVLVDYAHTPDALSTALASLRSLTTGRLICVFGCGGDRDHAKRPLMGRAVAGGADLALVTSDNPRTEDPAAIVDMIVPGVEGAGLASVDEDALGDARRGYLVEVDRARAIRLAIRGARANDTVLIAGKGHEDYQIHGTEKVHFDDREQAGQALAEIGGSDG